MSLLPFNAATVEKALDYFPLVKTAAIRAMVFPLSIAARTLCVPMMAFHFFLPKFAFSYKFPFARQITAESIKTGFFDPNDLPKKVGLPPKRKMHYLLRTFEIVRSKLHIKNQLVPYSSHELEDTTVIGIGLSSCSPLPVYIDPRLLNQPYREIDFVVAHEVSHAAHYDLAIEYLIHLGILTSEIAAFYFGNYYTIPLIEFAGSLFEKIICRKQEMAADSKAMEILNTNRGAVRFFEDEAKVNKEIRSKDIDAYRRDPKSYFNTEDPIKNLFRKIVSVFSDQVVDSQVAPDGTNREALKHPSISARINNALAFKPKT